MFIIINIDSFWNTDLRNWIY